MAFAVDVVTKDMLLVVPSVDCLVLDGHDEPFRFRNKFTFTQPQIAVIVLSGDVIVERDIPFEFRVLT